MLLQEFIGNLRIAGFYWMLTVEAGEIAIDQVRGMLRG
jgi:hypothetical protein